MPYIWSRNKREIVALDGIFDPSQDQTQMGANWWLIVEEDTPPAGALWDIASSPGGAGGYSHRIHGNISADALMMYGFISPYSPHTADRNSSFPVYSPYKWSYKAEFRMRIADDVDISSGSSGLELWGGSGFMIDACHQDEEWNANNYYRTMILFNVANQKMGIAGFGNFGYGLGLHDLYTWDWSGSYDTWYDIRIHWDYDFFTDPQTINISVYSTDTLLFSKAFPIEEWRQGKYTAASSTYNSMPHHAFQGRCGLGAPFFNDNTAITDPIDVYYKDILITLENPVLIEYAFTDSVMKNTANIQMSGVIVNENPYEVNKGTDIQLYKRASTSDDWNGRWRGTIRQVSVPFHKRINFEAEGLGIEFLAEKTEDMTLTTKTTAQIVIEALNNPDKSFINTTAYFDTVSNTYSRYYPNTVKMDILMEMNSLEGFISYFDFGNNYHFESLRNNYSEIHLKWGESLITSYDTKNITIRKPNRVRVNGSGVYAEAKIIEEMHTVGSDLIREVNRPDITVQADADAALLFYTALYRKHLEVLQLHLIEDYRLQKGSVITVTLDPLGIYNAKYLITDIASDNKRRCIIDLLEINPQAIFLLAELSSRTNQAEGEQAALDTVASDIQHNMEALAGLFVSAKYEIEYDSSIVDSGRMTITDEFVDDLLDAIAGTTTDDPTHIAVGTGQTVPQYTDTTLENESSRSSATATRTGVVMDFNSYYAGDPVYYHKIEFEIDIVDPSSLDEIGLFNAASNGTMACRAVFDSYTQTGTVTFRVILTVLPEPGSTYVTFNGVDEIIDWLYDGTWNDVIRFYHIFSPGLVVPSPFASNVVCGSYLPGNIRCHEPMTTKTLTVTPIPDLDHVVFQYDFTNWNRTGTGSCAGVVANYESSVIVVSKLTDPVPIDAEHFVLAWFFSRKLPGYYDGADTTVLWRIIVEIKRGEISY